MKVRRYLAHRPNQNIKILFVITAALAPFFLNDLAFAQWNTEGAFLTIDYISRLISITATMSALTFGLFSSMALGLNREHQCTTMVPAIKWTVYLSIVSLLEEKTVGSFLIKTFPSPYLYSIPPIVTPWIKVMDTSIGMTLIAFSEEVVFRGLLPAWLLRNGTRPIFAWTTSIILFGLAHWGRGPGNVLSSCLWAILPSIATARLKNLVPAFLAHWFTDLVVFF